MEIRKLNTLRGIAALIVVFSHFANFSGGRLHDYLNDSGQIGVMLFFMLSGFLMSVLYLHRPWTAADVRTYALARVGRVIPLYLVVVLLSFTLSYLGVAGYLYQIRDVGALLSHLLFLDGNSVLWTIPAEIIFYFCFLVLWWSFQRRASLFYLVCTLALLAVVALKFPRPQGEVLGLVYDIQFYRTLPFFIAGLLFGQLYRHWRIPDYLYRNVFVLALLLIPFLYPNIFAAITGKRYLFWLNLEVVFMLAAVFFAIVFMIPDDNPLLCNPIGDFLGRISYSLYLLHLPVLAVIKRAGLPGSPATLCLFLAATLLLSWLSYHIIESPLRNAIRNLGARPHGAGASPGKT